MDVKLYLNGFKTINYSLESVEKREIFKVGFFRKNSTKRK